MKPEINITNIQAGSFADACKSVPEELKGTIIEKAIEYYQDKFMELIMSTPFEDGIFVVNAMRYIIGAIQAAAPEIYEAATKMLPEDSLQRVIEEEKNAEIQS